MENWNTQGSYDYNGVFRFSYPPHEYKKHSVDAKREKLKMNRKNVFPNKKIIKKKKQKKRKTVFFCLNNKNEHSKNKLQIKFFLKKIQIKWKIDQVEWKLRKC